MAKKLNKTQIIRNILQDNPDAGPQEIVAAGRKQGVKFSAAYASTIKCKLRAGRAPTRRGAAELQAEQVLGFLGDIKRRFGGDRDKARAALDMLEAAGV